jgi:hypothetical protein
VNTICIGCKGTGKVMALDERGDTKERDCIACNGIGLPLHNVKYPIDVINESELVIDGKNMIEEKSYPFYFLDVQLYAQLIDGMIEIYQIVEEE